MLMPIILTSVGVLIILVFIIYMNRPIKGGDPNQKYFELSGESIEDFDNAIQEDPNNADLVFQRGVFKMDKELYDEAIIDFEKTLEIDDTFLEAQMRIAGIYLLKGDFDKTIERYQKIVDEYEDDYDVFINYASVLLEKYETSKNMEDIDKSRGLISKAIELDPKRSSGYSLLGDIAFNLKEYNDAVTSFSQAIEHAKKGAVELFVKRAKTYEQLGLIQEKEEDAKKAIEIMNNFVSHSATNPYSYNNRATIYSQLGLYDKAIEDLNKSALLDPDNELFKSNLEKVIEKKNEKKTGE